MMVEIFSDSNLNVKNGNIQVFVLNERKRNETNHQLYYEVNRCEFYLDNEIIGCLSPFGQFKLKVNMNLVSNILNNWLNKHGFSNVTSTNKQRQIVKSPNFHSEILDCIEWMFDDLEMNSQS
jgi:hypothetical protein